MREIRKVAVIFVIVGCINAITAFSKTFVLNLLARRIGLRIRERYLKKKQTTDQELQFSQLVPSSRYFQAILRQVMKPARTKSTFASLLLHL